MFVPPAAADSSGVAATVTGFRNGPTRMTFVVKPSEPSRMVLP